MGCTPVLDDVNGVKKRIVTVAHAGAGPPGHEMCARAIDLALAVLSLNPLDTHLQFVFLRRPLRKDLTTSVNRWRCTFVAQTKGPAFPPTP
jgi:hypothetical protein